MKLFYAPGSSSLFPHIVLHEAGLPFEPVKIDEHTKAIAGGGDYWSVNPLGYVPALVLDDGTLLTEGAAIVQYIADLVPSKELAPPNGTIERVRLQAWLNFFASEMHKGGFSPLFYKGVPENGRDVFRARLKARFVHLDMHLSANEYMMGNDYSVADAHFFVVSNWASWVNFDLPPYHAVIAHRKRVGARPAVVPLSGPKGLYRGPRPSQIDADARSDARLPFRVLCHEHRRSTRRCATVPEMKEGPSGSAIRSLIPSHRERLWSKATVVSVAETSGR